MMCNAMRMTIVIFPKVFSQAITLQQKRLLLTLLLQVLLLSYNTIIATSIGMIDEFTQSISSVHSLKDDVAVTGTLLFAMCNTSLHTSLYREHFLSLYTTCKLL